MLSKLFFSLVSNKSSLLGFSRQLMVLLAAIAYFFLALIFMAILAEKANAKTVVYGTTSEQIRIKYGMPTIFRFQNAVQTITGASRLQVEPANKADPSYKVLSVTPRFTNGTNEVTFFLTDNSVVRTKILVSPNDPAADTFYDFKSRESANTEYDPTNAPTITEIELLKAMYRDDNVSGYTVHRMSQYFPSKQGSANVELVRIYKGSPFNGYVFKVKNASWRKNLEIDVRHITVGSPNLAILSQTDEKTLFPKGKGPTETYVRVVAKNTASSRDVVLAMEADESEHKAGE